MENTANNKAVLFFSGKNNEYSVSGNLDSIEYLKTIICDNKLNNKKRQLRIFIMIVFLMAN